MKILLARALQRFAVIFVLFLILAPPTMAQTKFEVVHLPAAVLPNVASDASARSPAPNQAGALIWGHLGKPAGEGPFPAIVLLHGCGGLQQSHFNWANHLNQSGFVTLILDSFRPRSIIRQCAGGSAAASPSSRALDAYGALTYLSEQSFVDAGRIGLVGWSHGAIAALDAVARNGIESRFEPTFQAVAAFYPYCNPGRNYVVPVAMFIGEKDDWTPPEDCRKLAANNLGQFHEIDLTVYSGAFHAFDNPDLGEGFYVPGAFGNRHWLQYDVKAHADAKKRLVGFFKDRL